MKYVLFNPEKKWMQFLICIIVWDEKTAKNHQSCVKMKETTLEVDQNEGEHHQNEGQVGGASEWEGEKWKRRDEGWKCTKRENVKVK